MSASASALGIGLGLGRQSAGRLWVRPGAVLDADFAGGRFAHAGRNHPTKSAFLAAVGGVEAAGIIAIGPYDVPGAPERVTNGDFSTGTAGWTAFNGASLSVAAGILTLRGTGSDTPGFQQALSLTKGQAYRFRGKLRMSNGQQPALHVTRNPANLSSAATIHSDTLTTLHEVTSTFSAEEATIYVGGRQTAAASVLSSEFDDLSVREVLPFAGFAQGGFAAIVAGTMPAGASGTKVILEASDGAWNYTSLTSHNCVRLVWDASRRLRLIVRARNTEQANLDLGVVDISTPFEVLFSAKPSEFRAALRSGPVVQHASGDLPGIARLYLNRQNEPGSTFDGTLRRVSLYGSAWSETQFFTHQAGTP